MKNMLSILSAFLLFPYLAYTQVILANPNSNNVAQPIVTETMKRDVAFKLSNFSKFYLPVSTTDYGTTLYLPMKEFDLGNNTRENTFVAPENGIYHFDIRLNFTCNLSDYNNNQKFILMLCKNPETIVEKSYLTNPRSDTPFPPFLTLTISTSLMLKAGEVVYASYNGDAGGLEVAPVAALEASFSGFKVCSIEGDVITRPIIR